MAARRLRVWHLRAVVQVVHVMLIQEFLFENMRDASC
jgi:hypothetical protein